ncbi:hypothetical protein NYE33_33585 [Paenibacillus sp. FSL R10-2199]|uniref:hypothetical protein n=1 Tax=Paenibacillus sp. FSL R10-2199 TaxID=2975348 RepID=UPI0030FCEABF
MIAISDLQTLIDGKINNITFDMLKSFDVSNRIQGSYNQFFIELFLYSVSVFFHTPFYFEIVGPGQIIVIIESMLGYILPLLIMILTYKKNSNSKREQLEVLKIYLNRGWNVFRVRDGVIKGIEVVEIVSSEYSNTEMLYVSKSQLLDDLVRSFTIQWGKIESLNVLPYFARHLESLLSQEEYKLSSRASNFFYKKEKVNDDYYIKYYEFLVEVQSLEISLDYRQEISHILKLLKNHLGGEPNNPDDTSIDEVLVTEVEINE